MKLQPIKLRRKLSPITPELLHENLANPPGGDIKLLLVVRAWEAAKAEAAVLYRGSKWQCVEKDGAYLLRRKDMDKNTGERVWGYVECQVDSLFYCTASTGLRALKDAGIRDLTWDRWKRFK